MKRKQTLGNTIIVIVCILLAAVSLYPFWYNLIISLSSKEYVTSGLVWFWPKGFTLVSYKKILEDITFFKTLWVSIKRVIIGCSLQMLFMIITSYPLCLPDGRFMGEKFCKWFFIANMYISGGMVAGYMLIKSFGMMGSFWILVIPGAVPLGSIIFMINFFRNVPYSLNEAASMDGATPFQILTKVYVPMSKASLACQLLFSFLGHWNAYLDGLIYINDPEKQPLQTYIYQLNVKIDYMKMSIEQIMQLSQTSTVTLNAAKVMVAMIPILCVYPIIQKYFVTGMRLGAVKE